MLAQIADPNLRAYVVWLPVLPSGAWESAARREGGRIPDPRVTRYFDRDAHLGHLYGPILHLPEGLPAWDVYFVFAPPVRWEDKPPAPTYWMHQLGRRAPPELRLDGDQMARVVSGLLAAAGTGNSQGCAAPGFRDHAVSPAWAVHGAAFLNRARSLRIIPSQTWNFSAAADITVSEGCAESRSGTENGLVFQLANRSGDDQ